MTKTALTLAGTSTFAAKPWAELPQSVLDRTAFIHHATHTPVHGELSRVQRMMDATERNDMLLSLLARELAPRLGSVQADPVSLGASGSELLSSAGRVIGNVAPMSIRKALGGADGPLGELTTLRDAYLDRIRAVYRERGTPTQLALLDAWSRSRQEARGIRDSLLSRLDAIDGNDDVNQVRCAIALAAMNIAPVITIRLDFGRDNHADADLQDETEGHVRSIPMLGSMIEQLDALKSDGTLKHSVLVGSLNVFGRTHKRKGRAGRDHNPGHHAMIVMGDGVRGGVVGGLVANSDRSEYIASSIDSTTGKKGGDIAFDETLPAAGKTLGRLLGVPSDRLDTMIQGGKVVRSVVA
jgi:uncharacterized protein (DUF1501 family)